MQGDEVEFDFDSSPNDIAAGFIQLNASGPDVTGEIRNAAGVVVASASGDCEVR